jgi:SnoaL-like domain
MKSDPFRSAVETKDLSRLDDLFAEDVIFRSPVVFKPYEGRDAVRILLEAIVQVLEDFRYLEQVETGDVAVLVFEATAGDREVQGVDIIKFGEDGRIVEMTVMMRPMSGLVAVGERMKALLEASAA